MNYIRVKLSKNISAMTKKIYSLHIVNDFLYNMEGVHDWTMKNSTPATEQKLKSTTDQNRDKNETAQNVNEQKINMYSVTEMYQTRVSQPL